MDYTIRPLRPTDLAEVHRLAHQLGYEPSLDLVRENIARMLAHPDYTLVGIVGDEDVVLGWMSLAVRIKIEDRSFLQVAALVADEAHRGKGLGRQLMKFAENLAADRKLPYVGLHSSKRRTEAHEFYKHAGYSVLKESFYFRKDL